MVTYTSAPKAVGGFGESGSAGRPGVVFNVNDPIGDSIYRGEQVADGGTEFTAELNGIIPADLLQPGSSEPAGSHSGVPDKPVGFAGAAVLKFHRLGHRRHSLE